MKSLLTSILLLIFTSAFAQTPISPDSAKNHEGSLKTICGQVKGIHKTKTGMVKFEFGKPFPEESFAAIIYPEDTATFKSADYYKDKNVCITGRIKLHKGRAEIVLKNSNQLKEQ